MRIATTTVRLNKNKLFLQIVGLNLLNTKENGLAPTVQRERSLCVLKVQFFSLFTIAELF